MGHLQATVVIVHITDTPKASGIWWSSSSSSSTSSSPSSLLLLSSRLLLYNYQYNTSLSSVIQDHHLIMEGAIEGDIDQRAMDGSGGNRRSDQGGSEGSRSNRMSTA